MGTVYMHNIGALIAIATSVPPQAAAATVNGAGIDRLLHNLPLSCVLHQVLGAETGSPTGVSIQSKLQHSPDDATWTDYTPPGATTVAETAALTAASTENSLPIDLSSAQRYVRAVALITFTGGTSPTIQIVVDIVFGGEQLLPAA
jgi:hypothetical protein